MAHEFPGSDWGDAFLREIERAEPDGVAVWYLGCNGFVLKASDGTTLFVDPYLGDGDPPRTYRMLPVPFDPSDVRTCDAVLATHEHSDHVNGPSQAPLLAETGAKYLAPDDSLAVTREEGWTDRWDVDPGQFREVTEGETAEVGAFAVHVEPAHDPDATHPVSYVVAHEAGTFFHGGDARPSEAFARIGAEYDIDLGALAFGSGGLLGDDATGDRTETVWYSTGNEIARAAAQLELGRLLPTHWDVWKGLTADPRGVRDHTRSYDHPRAVEVVEIGDRIALPWRPRGDAE